MLTPRHRYLAVKEAKKPPEDALGAELYNLLRMENPPQDTPLGKALDIFKHEFKRETLEAALLSGMTADEIQEILRVDAAIVHAYQHFFFDTAVFESRLDEIDYAHTYKESAFGRDLKKLAVDLGKDCLKIRISDGNTGSIPPAKIVDSIRRIAFLSINMMRTDRMNVELSNFAQRWASIGLKTADIKQEAPNSALEALRLALETTEHKQPDIDPDQIIH